MRNRSDRVSIFIVESSRIISEGLAIVIDQSAGNFSFDFAKSLTDFNRNANYRKQDIVIVNPLLIKNQEKFFLGLREDLVGVRWLALIYSLFDSSLMTLFDDTIFIDDSTEAILAKIKKLTKHSNDSTRCVRETLSAREIELLKLLVSGNSNKEIANILNISINTVITHRKNISQKTSIKSASGLAIYAVTNGIIDVESFS